MNGHFDRIMKVAERPPVAMVKGAGSWLWDRDGKRYLDFVQGWAVNCLGHSPPVVLEALTAQAAQLINCSPAYYNEPMAKLADLLAEASGLDQVFLCTSGAEANEGAIKLARKWGPGTATAPTRSSPCTGDSTGARWRRWPPRARRAGTSSSSRKSRGFARSRAGDADEGAGHPTHRRRDPDRHRTNRPLPRLPACRHRARHRHAGQGAGWRGPARGAGGHRQCQLLRIR